MCFEIKGNNSKLSISNVSVWCYKRKNVPLNKIQDI